MRTTLFARIGSMAVLGLALFSMAGPAYGSPMSTIVKLHDRCALQDVTCRSSSAPYVRQMIEDGPAMYTLFIWTYATTCGMILYGVVIVAKRLDGPSAPICAECSKLSTDPMIA